MQVTLMPVAVERNEEDGTFLIHVVVSTAPEARAIGALLDQDIVIELPSPESKIVPIKAIIKENK